ncbi:hypothetical protein [Streptomyces sp. DvalAA-19]|uniref:hypothetical protein n=1 Tax=Streptomyces sp. DvalAA-19 TaxID=1839761 RepID=UPI00081B51A5|nr:hypothetical protein [Streptomyces sp. DvalAA-19]SCE43754.1 hypothetical protein GA0115244_127142 [Streptomyces sp. DvalAA-19]
MSSRKRNAGIAVTGVAVLAACAGLFSWWNTNLLGEAEFCEGVVDSADMRAVLGTQGRLSTVWSTGSEVPEVACRVNRTSKFLGAEAMEVTLTTAVHKPDFQFQTHVWKNPSAMSYFSKGSTGAVSDERGWVLLPDSCRDKIGTIYPARRQLPEAGEVTVVEAVMNQGTADRSALAKMLVRAAQRIADDAGCGAGASSDAPGIQNPSGLSTTDAAAVCRLPGFKLPQNALVKGEATVGKEQTTGSMPGTWSCGLELSGSADAKYGSPPPRGRMSLMKYFSVTMDSRPSLAPRPRSTGPETLLCSRVTTRTSTSACDGATSTTISTLPTA